MRALSELVDHPDYGEALTYDLLGLGLRMRDLGSPALTWREVLTVVRHQTGSALERAMFPEEAAWGLPEQLLALIADTLAIQFWADHNRKAAHKPKPLERPGVSEKDTAVYGAESAVTIEEFDAWFAVERSNMN